MFNGAEASDPMPWAVALLLGLLLLAVGVFSLVLAQQARSGRLQRNWIVGIRTHDTLASDEAWMSAHRAAAGRLAVAGGGPLLVGALLLTRPSNGVGAVATLAGLAWMVGWVIHGAIVGQRAISD